MILSKVCRFARCTYRSQCEIVKEIVLDAFIVGRSEFFTRRKKGESCRFRESLIFEFRESLKIANFQKVVQ